LKSSWYQEDLSDTEGRLVRKIELETEKIAQMVARESARLWKRDEELALEPGPNRISRVRQPSLECP